MTKTKKFETDAKIEINGESYIVKVIAGEQTDLDYVRERKDEIRPYIEKLVRFGRKEIYIEEILKNFQEEDEYERNRLEKSIEKSRFR